MRKDLIQQLDSLNKPYKICAEIVEDIALQQFIKCMKQDSIVQGFLAPDCHVGYVAPIGSVLKSKDTIFPSFVGYDIGCGLSSAILNIDVDDILPSQLISIKDNILKKIPIGFKKRKKRLRLSKKLINMPKTNFAKEIFNTIGVYQIGTLGGGNHFLELGKNNDNKLSIVVHSGSRGVGHKIATYYMKEALIQNIDKQIYENEFDNKNQDWYLKSEFPSKNAMKIKAKYIEAKEEFVQKCIRKKSNAFEDAYPLDIYSKVGKDYIDDMNSALFFALENREEMINQCINVISKELKKDIEMTQFINKNHNHAQFVDNFWIHRKGATQANKDMLGVIPGNMVDGSFIVKGKGNLDSMCSSSHGAGRVLSRKKAKDTLLLDEFIESTKHLVSNHSDNNLDEAPKAYKNIFEVMQLQNDLVEVIDRVIPIINIKG